MIKDRSMPHRPAGLSRRALLGAMAAVPLIGNPAFSATLHGKLMVQGRPQDSGSNYKLGNILHAMDQLGGVRMMRCREPYTGTLGWNTYVGLARAGVKFSFTLSVRDPARSLADLRSFLHAAPGSVWAIEYPNEPDLNPVMFNGARDARLGYRTGNAPSFMRYIQTMHSLFAADPQLRSIPIIASNDYMQREQGPFSTFGNAHIYPRETADIAGLLGDFRQKIAAGGHRQGVITEWGRTTGGGWRNFTQSPVTVARQADLIAADLRQIFADPSVAAVSLYELFSWPGPGEMENFGLFDADLKPRPVVARIREVMS